MVLFYGNVVPLSSAKCQLIVTSCDTLIIYELEKEINSLLQRHREGPY
jgi:hypothetical protein